MAKTLADLFHDRLQDAYSAETQIAKALPKMAKATTSPQLKAGFEKHLTETQNQLARLEQVCQMVGCETGSNTWEAMEGLVKEGEEVIDEESERAVKDAALVASAQRVEHYEIAGYGCVRTFATLLGYTDAAELLQQTLNEEGEADKRLTELAESVVNVEAEEGDEDEADEAEGEGEDEEAGETPASKAKPAARGKRGG
jgi:ferritin-like metal-binding protein YciE